MSAKTNSNNYDNDRLSQNSLGSLTRGMSHMHISPSYHRNIHVSSAAHVNVPNAPKYTAKKSAKKTQRVRSMGKSQGKEATISKEINALLTELEKLKQSRGGMNYNDAKRTGTSRQIAMKEAKVARLRKELQSVQKNTHKSSRRNRTTRKNRV
jgi:predicted RNase H-like nuclease (RuvC/YqgF family)